MNHFYSFFILAALLAFTSAGSGDPEWVTLEEAQELSAEDQKPLFVFVEAEWCGICKRMRREVFPDPEINRQQGSVQGAGCRVQGAGKIYF